MKDIIIRNNEKNLQLLALYEKIQLEDSHPDIDRVSILDRALNFVIENKSNFKELSQIKLESTYVSPSNSSEFIHIKASKDKISIVSEMIRECFDISVVQMPFLVKLVLVGYYTGEIKNTINSSANITGMISTARIKRAIAELTLTLAEIEKKSVYEVLESIRKEIKQI